MGIDNFNYFEELEEKLDQAYEVAREARSKGKDPSLEPEIPVAENMAMRVEGLVGPDGVGERIKVLDEEKGREMASFQIAKEIIDGKFGELGKEESAEQAIRTALAIMTEGIVAAPLEGIADVKIRENDDGSEHLAIYFAGPIRSAGGTAQALSVLIGEYVRSILKLDKYEPRKDEIERYVEEINLYERHVTALQYSPSVEEVKDVVKNVPIEITGESTSDKNVEGYKDLDRVETNGIRGGAVLVIAEGMLQKINKMLRYVNDLDMTGWEWLRDFHDSEEEKESEELSEQLIQETEKDKDLVYDKLNDYDSDKYMADFIAGRPLFGMPSERGGFRLRYGRSRDSGFATWSIHPASMAILDNFLAVGTQMKTQLPGKACITTPNDKIDGPIVKLEDGEVRKLKTFEEGRRYKDRIEEIIYLGDALVCFGEFLENNHELVPSPYVEEWWVQDLVNSLQERDYDVEEFTYNELDFEFDFIDSKKLVNVIEDPLEFKPSFDEALDLSNNLNIPLHPEYLFYWKALDVEELFKLLNSVEDIDKAKSDDLYRLDADKEVLEKIGVPHRVDEGDIVLEERWYKTLKFLSDDLDLSKDKNYRNALEFLKNNSSVTIKPKGHVFVGGRMGRPEKAKERKMRPPVHVLFPIGDKGGRTRNVVEAAKQGRVKVQAAQYECPKCGTRSMQKICPNCGTETELIRHCPECGDELKEEKCPNCNVETVPYEERELNIGKKFSKATNNTNEEGIGLVKGVEGMSSKYKIHEPLTKGVLRSKNDVYVYKDGTSRYDITDAPLTHFKPKEINVPIKKLKEKGYKTDIKGKPLKNKNQILELKPQDILLPDSAADYLMNVADFIDSLLEKLYNQKPYYNVNKREDLVGKLVIGLAPHTSAGVIGRILGFTKAKVGYAHPYFHAAKRRNCFHPNTKVWIKNSENETKKLKIKKFVEKHLNPEKAKKDDFGTLYQKIEQPILTPSIDKNGNKTYKKIKAISKHKPTDHMIKITTENGRTLKVTPDHSMIKWNQQKIQKLEARELKTGDQIPILMENDLTQKTKKELKLDKIKEITVKKSEVKNTYSLTVEDTHTLPANELYTGQCDGDEDAVMLILDGLLNFSNYYLPNTRGGKMDAPLVITTRLDPKEVDDEVHNMDIVSHYTKKFYENSYNFPEPKETDVEIVEERLNKEDPYSNFHFTHDTTNISDGPEFSSYKTLGSMGEKIDSQFDVIQKLRSVDETIAAEKVIEKHFIPDLVGNLRSFSKQKMRCVDCNAKYRRIPLSGKCPKCGGKLVLTVSRGSVEKYLDISEELIQKYDIPTYTEHRIELIKKEIKSMFESDRQTSITDFF